MRKHQFVKNDCNCDKRATYYTCVHCGGMEYAGQEEITSLDVFRATCSSPDAPMVQPAEKFKASMGGAFNCLAPEGAAPLEGTAQRSNT